MSQEIFLNLNKNQKNGNITGNVECVLRVRENF